jgi:hypothetical protein
MNTIPIIVLSISLVLFLLLKHDNFENIPNTLTKSETAFPECSNCVRYYDIVICKCNGIDKKIDNKTAFLYPTDLTPDIPLNQISNTNI